MSEPSDRGQRQKAFRQRQKVAGGQKPIHILSLRPLWLGHLRDCLILEKLLQEKMQATQRHLEELCERVAALEKERDQLQSALEVSAREAQVQHVFGFVHWDHQFSNFQLSHMLLKQRI